jgi:hypothetical protein
MKSAFLLESDASFLAPVLGIVWTVPSVINYRAYRSRMSNEIEPPAIAGPRPLDAAGLAEKI